MKSGLAWPIGITAILCTTVAANLFVMRLASNDPAFAVEPDYYRKAVHFDSTMAQERRNLALGWQSTTLLDSIREDQATPVRVLMRDTSAAPLTGAQVALMARFNARANDTLTAVLREVTPGDYATTLPIRTPGEWEVRIDVTRNGVRYSTSQRVVAVRAIGASAAAH